MTDNELLKECDISIFKATGKGGQKRNKTSSAVRLTHKEFDISVYDSSTRSQHDNKLKSLKKLRNEIALEIRGDDFEFNMTEISLRNPQYHLWIAKLFDALENCEFRTKDVAEQFNFSNSKLLKLIYRDTVLWQKLNNCRTKLGLNKLKI